MFYVQLADTASYSYSCPPSPHTASSSVVITNGPRNATTVVGGEVTFQCEYEGTNDLPKWNINGWDFGVTNLPYGHWFSSQDGLHACVPNNS